MMSQFMMDLKQEELRKMPVTHFIKQMKNRYSPGLQQPEEVLDLSSKRRDSIESRKTSSPYENSSFEEDRSPNNCRSALKTPEHLAHFSAYKQERVSPILSAISLNQRTPPPPMYPQLTGFPFVPMINQFTSLSPNPDSVDHSIRSLPTNGYFVSSQPVHQPQICRENEESNDNFSDHTPVDVSSNSSSVSQKTNSPSSSNSYPMVVGRDGKLSRPFKAYPKDPLSLAAGSLLDTNSTEKYQIFRKRMLEQIHAANGGNPTITNPKMRRINGKNTIIEANNNEIAEQSEEEIKKPPQIPSPEPQINTVSNTSSVSNGNGKDSAYYERRKKNNAAAKKSRDRRRIKEDEIAIRAAFLERENIELKFEIAALRKQINLYTAAVPS